MTSLLGWSYLMYLIINDFNKNGIHGYLQNNLDI